MAWRDFLIQERARLFVGRERELDLITAFLDGSNRLLYISGPAGVGKTALLHELERIARGRDRRVCRLDAALLAATPAAIASEMAERADVIVIDEFDAIAALHGWLRDAVFPDLPSATRVVVAGRSPPDEHWLVDSGWRRLAQWMPLHNLQRSATIEYLQRRGADRAQAEELARMAQGHPLCLSVLGGLVGDDRPAHAADAATTIESIIRRVLVDGTPPERLRVLEAAALATAVDEPLLTAMIGEDACGALRWLASQPFVEATDRGLRLHEIAADAIVAEMRWRNPDRMRLLRRAALRHCVARVRDNPPSSNEAEVAFWRVLRLLAHEPAVRLMTLSPESSALYVDVGREPDRRAFADAIERFEGPFAGQVARAWLECHAAELHAVRDSTGAAVGFALYLHLPGATTTSIRDPIVDAFVATLTTDHPLRERERATLCRWFISVDAYQAPDPVQAQLFLHMAGRLAFSPGVVVGASVHRDPDVWLRRPDCTHALLAQVEAWGGTYGLFGTDWRREPAWAWFERVIDTLSGMGKPCMPPAEVVVLERSAFAREVKRVLRHFHDTAALRRSPLTCAPLVRRQCCAAAADPPTEYLREVTIRAIDRLGRDHAALLRAAFIEQPRRKQLAVADELGMGFSTYRRHLAGAIRQLVDALWADELGPMRVAPAAPGRRLSA